MNDFLHVAFHFEREPHPDAAQAVRHGVYVPAARGRAQRSRIGHVEWRPGGTYRAVSPDGVSVSGFASSEGAAGFLLGRWLRTAPEDPVDGLDRFGAARETRHDGQPVPSGGPAAQTGSRHGPAEGGEVPDVFAQIAAEFGEDRTDLIVAEHRMANDNGRRHSLDEVLGLYGLTREDLRTSDDQTDDDSGGAAPCGDDHPQDQQ